MQKIIEDIYYGRLSVSEQTYPKGSQYDETLSEVVKLAEDLQTLLLSEHHDTLRAYAMACGNLASLSKAADFVKGFRLGAQVILAVLLPDGPQQPSIDKPLEQQATTRPLTAFL